LLYSRESLRLLPLEPLQGHAESIAAQHAPAIDDVVGTGDEGGFVGREKQRQLGGILGQPAALDQATIDHLLMYGGGIQMCSPRRLDIAGTDADAADAVRCALLSPVRSKRDDATLGGRVRRTARP